MSRATTTPSFHDRVYVLLRQVPAGRVTTYQALAEALGTRAYRAVGQAMKMNPNAPRTPCHRVVSADGGLGGYQGGLAKKAAILGREGVVVREQKVVNFPNKLFTHFR